MAQVTLRINGYAYTIGCRDGEEEHLLSMASEVELRIDSIKAMAGQSGEARLLVMAALMMADELFELHKRLARADAEDGTASDLKLSRKLNRIAERAEDIADGLERP